MKNFIFFLFGISFFGIDAFYLPGLAPVNYCKKEEADESCKVRFKNRSSLHITVNVTLINVVLSRFTLKHRCLFDV